MQHVPKTFVKKMRGDIGKGTKVKLQTSNNEMFVNMTMVGKQWRMNSGWRNFLKEESIEIDDVCVLELVDKKNDVIRISIFRRNTQVGTPLCAKDA